MILIITNKDDAHADIVISQLNELGASCFRLNTEDFPQFISITWELDGQHMDGTLRAYGIHETKLSAITACWDRRPMPPVVSNKLKTSHAKKFAQNESRQFLRDLRAYLSDRFWINYRYREDEAENKMSNLKRAAELGMNTPATLITTNPKDAEAFIKKHNGNVICKMLGSVLLQNKSEKTAYQIYTHKLTSEDLHNLESVSYLPTQLQEYIEKKLELRVTTVGEKIFACEIHSQDSEKTKIDWRNYDFKNVKHLPHQLPKSVEKNLLAMLDGLQLNFGVFDLILTPDNQYVFIELNPSGQYMWIENLTKMPISRSIAELLISRNA